MPSYQRYARKIGLPKMVKCYTCKRSKEIEEFAPAEQRNLSNLMLASGHIPNEHGAQCKICRNAPRRTTCFSCNRSLEDDDFTKTQRRRDEPLCKRCVAWEETQEPKFTPTPHINGHVSAEEVPDIVNRQQKTDADFYSDGDEELPPTSRSGTASIKDLVDKVSDFELNASGSQPSSSMSQLQGQSGSAPFRWGRNSGQDKSEGSRSDYTASTTNTNKNASTQRLVRGLPQNLTHREPRVGSSWPTISTATTVRDDGSHFGRATGDSFNAWDARGVQHRRHNAHKGSSMTSTEASSTQESSGRSAQNSKWPRKSQQGEQMW